MKKLLIVLTVMVFLMPGCAGTKQKVKENKRATGGAIAGAVIGAGVGYATGGGKGAAVGAAVGALAGGTIGYMMDKQERDFKQALAQSEDASVKRVKQAEQDAIILTFKSDMWFDFDSSTLKPGANSELDRVAAVLNRYPGTKIRIEGHTDSVGDESYNLKLSEKRAQAVKDALVGKNVDAARMEILGLGESQPVASNDTPEGRQQNRRVSIVIVPVEQQSSS